jgi:hypothetical protein
MEDNEDKAQDEDVPLDWSSTFSRDYRRAPHIFVQDKKLNRGWYDNTTEET